MVFSKVMTSVTKTSPTRFQFLKEPPSPSSANWSLVCDNIDYQNCDICCGERAELAWGRLDSPI